jgi:hypothetical protein
VICTDHRPAGIFLGKAGGGRFILATGDFRGSGGDLVPLHLPPLRILFENDDAPLMFKHRRSHMSDF